MEKQYDYVKDGLTDSNFRPFPWTILTGLIILVSSILYSYNWFTVVGVNDDLAELGADVFLKYLFIVVAVERAAAVFVGMFRNQSQVDWSLRINRISEVLQRDNSPTAVLKQVYTREHRLVKKLEEAKIIGTIHNVSSNSPDEDYVGYLTSTKHAYEFQRARFDSVSNRYVARIVFFVGILLATLGLSVFQDLFQNINLVSAMDAQIQSGELTKAGLAWQTGLLRFADIVITGGLLGGGSAGLNAIANKVTEFLNKP